ncbi:SDR family oxidoreductase [Sphingomonas sp. MMS24-J45]|uniref:SDR family oxidoreductase n=1 Tax=Sphingomonas sp. MMS24-J45 TaxID=3238806 RepID=UPI00384D46AB
MIAVTGASGQLGRLIIAGLLEKVAPATIVALVRDPAKLADLAERGITVRAFDYNRPETLGSGLAGVDRLLLISSSEVGQREAQHRAVIDAARAAGVGFIAYTSILHADTNPLDLAIEHRATEQALTESGVPHALLRNGWYTENYALGAASAVAHGALFGSAGSGRISGASRADYAAAAVAVLTAEVATPATYELAGDDAFTLTDLAAALSDLSGKTVTYQNLPEADYRTMLEQVGLPAPLAAMLAESDAKAAADALFDDGHALRDLIGRPTTPWRTTLQSALNG